MFRNSSGSSTCRDLFGSYQNPTAHDEESDHVVLLLQNTLLIVLGIFANKEIQEGTCSFFCSHIPHCPATYQYRKHFFREDSY